MRLPALVLCLTASVVMPLTYPDHDIGGDPVAEGSVSVGLYLTTMSAKELGVQQLRRFLAEVDDDHETAAFSKAGNLSGGSFVHSQTHLITFELQAPKLKLISIVFII